MTYKNIRIKKRGGGTRLQRVKVLKSGKFKFVKNIGGRVRKTLRKRSNPKRRVRKTARRRRKGRRRYSMTIPIAPIAGLAAGLARPVAYLMQGNYEFAMNRLCSNYTGFDPGSKSFKWQHLQEGLIPLVIGGLVHKFVGGTLGINRMLGRAKVPLIRL